VRRAGTQLRITAQLIDGTTDSHLWAEKYSGSMDDVFEMQERISRTIVEELRVRLDDVGPRSAPVTDIETYELYLRAKHLAGESVMRMPEAMECLEKALQSDPSFAPACCAMGALHVQAAFFGYMRPRPAWDRVKQLADQAIALDPRSGRRTSCSRPSPSIAIATGREPRACTAGRRNSRPGSASTVSSTPGSSRSRGG